MDMQQEKEKGKKIFTMTRKSNNISAKRKWNYRKWIGLNK
jgi:hypothetical protein